MSAARPLGYAVVAAVWLHHVAIAYLARLPVAHLVLTPILAASLPVGVTTLARGRRLRLDDGDDVTRLALIATGIWLLVPRYLYTCADRDAVVDHVVGLAVAVWLLVGVGTVVRRGALPAFASPLTFAGLVVAGVLARDLDVGRALTAAADSGHEWNLHLVNLAMRGSGMAVATVVLVWVGQIAWSRCRGRAPRPLLDDDVAVMSRALAVGALVTAVVVVTAVPSSVDLVPTGTAIAVAVACLVAHLGDSRRGRVAIVIAVVAIHVALAAVSVRTLLPAYRRGSVAQGPGSGPGAAPAGEPAEKTQ